MRNRPRPTFPDPSPEILGSRGTCLTSRARAVVRPLASITSGKFTANAAWLTLASIAFNLTRAAARLASATLSKARTATVRRTLIQVAGRIANQARRWRLHLPRRWPWQDELDTLYTAALGPPAPTTT